MKRSSLQFLAVAATLLTASARHVEEPLQDSCTVTSYTKVEAALKSCTNIVLDGITVPAGTTLQLNLQTGSTLTFKGVTKFNYYKWAGPLIEVKGSKVTVKGESGAVLNGQGEKYWDGKGSSGSTKPKFFRIKTTGGSTFSNINLKNCPVHCVSINTASDTTLSGWTIDVSDGDSAGGHNTDGFDISSSSNILIENSVVKNQDDCVAVNQGSGFVFKKLTCSGGHGLSLSVGQSTSNGSPNTVSNVTFSDCVVTNSRNGIHVKTHSDAGTGSVSDVTYSGIQLSGITNYGINVQEDYENGSSSGTPKSNIPIKRLNLINVTGSMSGGSSSMGVYILCATSGCSDWTWSGVSITNSKKSNSCNFTPSGFSC